MLSEGPLTDNQALNEILQTVQFLAAQGVFYGVTGNNNVAVTSTATTIPTDNTILKRVVTNLGAAPVQITEDGFIVAVITQYQTWESVFTGAGVITLTSLGAPTTCAVANYTSAPTS